jgi:hypothetical protein
MFMKNGNSAAPSLKEAQQALQRTILEDGRLDRPDTFAYPERLSVYADGYVARLHEALQESYELVYRVVGEERSDSLIYDYVHDSRPTSYNITNAGSRFAPFLERHPAGKLFPFLPDLARLEWAIVRAFHAKQETPFDPSQISSLSPERWETLRFTFQPAAAVISSAWPIYDLWKARKKPDEEFQIPKAQEHRPCDILIYRSSFDVLTLEISREEAALLRFLMEGATLGEACARLSETESVPDVSPWFAQWVQLGLVTACRTESTQSA